MNDSNNEEHASPLLPVRPESQNDHSSISGQELVSVDGDGVLYENASTATLNSVQNFNAAAYSNKDGLTVGAAGDGTFEPLTVEGEVTSETISGLIQPDGQFIRVDSSGNLCDDENIYLADGRQITYIVSQDNSLSHDRGKEQAMGVEESLEEQSTMEQMTQGEGDDDMNQAPMMIHTEGDATVSADDVISSSTGSSVSQLLPGANVRTELVPASSLDPEEAKNYHTVTVTLLNNDGTDPEQEGGATGSDSASNVISITEHTHPVVSTTRTLNTAEAAAAAQIAASTSRTGVPLYNPLQLDLNSGQCSFCDYSTNQRHLLHKHIKTHSEERPHKCHLCGNGFKTVVALNNHINTHSGIRPHKCKACDSAFTTSGELIRHIRYKHTFEKPHKCTLCNYASVELSKMKRHMRTHTGERPYQCPQCDYSSADTYKLKRHMRIHTGERPYACDICNLRFTQSNSLKAHRLIHTGGKPVFQCELCPATCGRKTDLRIHMQKLHSKEGEPLECRKCQKIFPDRYNYKLHMKSHEGEKTYKCGMCEFATLTEKRLEEHIIAQHENHRPYQCAEENCGATFRYKSLLRRHKIFKHGTEDFHPLEKIRECTCGKRFTMSNNQLRHQELHAGNTMISSVLSVLQDIEDIDDIGEDISVEVREEIEASNPHICRDAQPVVGANITTVTTGHTYIGDEDGVTQRLTLADESDRGDNLVMRRIVKEVEGHRVVVMEMGPPETGEGEEGDEQPSTSVRAADIYHNDEDNRLSGERDLVGGSISQDAAVQILYNLAADNHLPSTSDAQQQDMSSEHHDSGDMSTSLPPSGNVVTLEMEALPDNVMSVQEVTDGHELEEYTGSEHDQSNLEQISLSVQAASTTLMQLKRSAIEQQAIQKREARPNRAKRRKVVD